MLADRRIGVIGVGNMGSALIGGLLEAGLLKPDQIWAADVDDERLAKSQQRWGIAISEENREVASKTDVVLLAVKPQIMGRVLEEMAGFMEARHLVISIAAGVTTHTIEAQLGAVPVVRVMPNTPALVGVGMAALCAGQYASSAHLDEACELLACVGETVVVEEKQMDAVTGLSGSGPAYIFVVIDALADGGVKMGLPKPVALKLATQTVLGSAKMLLDTQEHPAQLKDRVTSPGGTTIAGLHKLEEKGLRDALMSAVQAATVRSAELGKG